MLMAGPILLPGDTIDRSALPGPHIKRIGVGLAPNTELDGYSCTVAGQLRVDPRKSAANIETPNARYIPTAGDLVIAQVFRSASDFFYLYLNPHSPQAFLPQLAFEGATKKTRPLLKPNDLVYAKVVSAQRNMEVELSCVNPSSGKAEPDGLGPLTGGMVFDVSIGLAHRLLDKQNVLALEELGAKLQGGFEVAVGKNGKVWVNCPNSGVKGICAVGRCLREIDEGKLTEKEQKKLTARIIKEMELG